MSVRIVSIVLLAASSACGAQTSSAKTGGTAVSGECKEVEAFEFPGVKAGDKPEIPKEIEKREVAAGKREFHVSLEACVGPGGNLTSVAVKQSSGVADLDEHVKKTVEGWTFCSYMPEREESKPRCDTLNFDYQIKEQPATQPATMPSGTPTPGP